MQVPAVLSHPDITHWVKTRDAESFAMCRRLIRTEGLLVGGSAGASVAAAVAWLKTDEGRKLAGGVKGKNVVVVLADSCVLPLSSPRSRTRWDSGLAADPAAGVCRLRNYITSDWLNEDSAASSTTVAPAHQLGLNSLSLKDHASANSGLVTPPQERA